MNEYENFDVVAKLKSGTAIGTANLWREYLTTFMTRMTSWAGNWVSTRADELEQVWTEVLHLAPDQATFVLANGLLGQMQALRGRLRGIYWDNTMLILP
jgi:hypothetical protein